MAEGAVKKRRAERYFHHQRRELVELVPPGMETILELGCGAGNTGLLLKELFPSVKVVGIEINRAVAQQAGKLLDGVLVGDVEEIVSSLPDGAYDCVLAGDILEHLRDPWRVLQELARKLRGPGYVIASLPNIRYWQVSLGLVFGGEWAYSDAGILDRTHLRFFTKKGMLRLFHQLGYQPELIRPVRLRKLRTRIFNRITFGIFEELFAIQYLIRVRLSG